MSTSRAPLTDFSLAVSALTPRCVVVALRATGLQFTLPSEMSYTLVSPAGESTGTATTSAVILDDLVPNTAYVLRLAGQELVFATPDCAGLVDASDFGLSEDAANNADAINAGVAATPKGGTLRIPAGRYVTGPVLLKPNMTLHLSKGAVLFGSADRSSHYGQLPSHDAHGRMLGSWEGLPAAMYKSLITAIDCTGLSIAGLGTLDGGGAEGDWWTWPKETREGARRPRTIYALRCDGLTLAGITVRNSPSWTVHPVLCDDAVFAGLTIWNPSDSPNTDGLDPEMCRYARLEGIYFSVGDDCIAVKSGKRSDTGNGDHLAPTSHLTIRNCRMERGHGAVVMGSEMSGSITDVSISDCEFVGTDRGLRIKTRRGRGGEVARITCERSTMDKVDTALSANGYYYCDWDGRSDAVQNRMPAPVTDLTPHVHSITLRDCEIRNVRLAFAAVLGLSERPIEGVSIENVVVSFDPDAVAEAPLMADNIPELRHVGIWSKFAEVRVNGSLQLAEISSSASSGV